MAFTKKQKAAIAKASKAKKQQLIASFKNDNKDSSMLRGIKQGVGRTVPRPFGSSRGMNHCEAFDAFHHCHAPLPRAVGPYSVVRSTQVIADNKPLTILGPFYDRSAGRWSDVSGVAFNTLSAAVGAASNVNVLKFGTLGSGSWDAAQVTPAAFSVQVMNPNALQTTSGIVYVGRIRTALKLSEDLSITVQQLCDFLVSYNNPRLCAAAKLAFRGVQVDLVPYNMSELANFTAIAQPTFTQYGADSPNPYGFAPMFIYNPNTINLQLLSCCEWRVRFDPQNPAQATHVLHPPHEESWWHNAQVALESVGNGVVDIADRVANTGNAVFQAMGSMYSVARGAQALRGAGGALALV